MVAPLDIGGRAVGRGARCFVIAEAGVNHYGSIDAACQLVDVACDARADAVKFQTFTAESLVTPDAPKAAYQLQRTSAAESQLDMLRGLELSKELHRTLFDYCGTRGILFLSTPFDEESADFLDALGVPAFKISSGELTNLPLLDHIARKHKPIILSTGMASLGEVEVAVDTIAHAGNPRLALLHCVSAYPADPCEVNLRAIKTLAEAFQLPVGYSDHTLGQDVALAAVALGASILEKHFTLSRDLPGPDHQASLEPDELTALVRAVRTIEAAFGDGRKAPVPSEASTAAVARKSLVAAADIPAGAVIAAEAIAVRRPGTGLSPAMLPHVVGRTARVRIPRWTVIGVEMLV